MYWKKFRQFTKLRTSENEHYDLYIYRNGMYKPGKWEKKKLCTK